MEKHWSNQNLINFVKNNPQRINTQIIVKIVGKDSSPFPFISVVNTKKIIIF